MARLVMLHKRQETDNHVVYSYGMIDEEIGQMKFNKQTGEHEVINSKVGWYYFRALSLLNGCREEGGIYPDTISHS
jgi:hypothetical protein